MNRAKIVAGLLTVGLLAASALPVMATTHDNRPKILIHVKGTTTKNACTFGGAGITNCDSTAIVTNGAITPSGGPNYYYMYLLVARGNVASIAGLQCGIAYQNGNPGDIGDLSGIDIFGWVLCATLEFQQPSPVWPRPFGGNLITWDSTNNCQMGEIAVAGYFYAAAYAPGGYISLIPRPVDGAAKVANCQNTETNLNQGDLGWAQFSVGAVTPGCNPCQQICPPVAVETTTWGGIKSLFKN